MKKLDLYIIKKYLGTYFYTIGLLIIIIVFFDLSEKIDSFIGDQAKPNLTLGKIVIDYYGCFIPYFLSLFSPLFIFVSVIFFTSKMAGRTEIIAILSSGVSFNRFLRPYMVVAFILCIANIFLNNFIIPPANKHRLAFENTFIHNAFYYEGHDVHRQIEPGTFAYFESYTVSTNSGQRFSLEKIKDGKISYKLMSDYIEWDSIKNLWKIHNFFIRKFDSLGNESYRKGAIMDTILKINPKEFSTRMDNIESMNYFELNKYIEDEKAKGVDRISFYEVEKYKRFAFPFATLILTLIGVSISSRKTRGGIGAHIGMGLGITFSYLLFMQVSTTFSTFGSLPTFFGVWIPNFVYSIIALLLVKNAQK